MTIPKVVSGTFELPTGKVIEIGETAWFDWLELPETRSFRFDDGVAGFTARKEKVKGQDGYWYAYASVLGKTRKKYLGKTDSLTQDRMIEVERQLHNFDGVTQNTQGVLPNASPDNARGKSASAVTFDVEGLKAEILAELRSELHRELGKGLTGDPRLGESQAETELAAAQQQIAELTLKQVDIQAAADRLQAELDDVRSQLASSRADVQEVNRLYNESKNDLWVTSGNLRLREEEVEALKVQLATVTETVTEANSQPADEKPDFDAMAAAALASLKLGSQAPGYKSARKAIAKFKDLLERC